MKEELDLLIIKKNNMNPKQKAAYLVVKYMSKVVSKNVAKECALVAVDEILKLVDETMKGWLDSDIIAYWEEVKYEIEKA